MKRWTDIDIDRLRAVASTGEYASVIAAALGVSHASILMMAGRNNIPINPYTPAEQALMDAKKRLREERKNAKRRAANKRFIATIINSKTSSSYRNSLPKIRDMSKSELRAMLTEALRNTVGAQV